MSKEVRLNDKIWFGKYKDRTIRQILEHDKAFLDDLVNKGKMKYADNVVKYLDGNNEHKRWTLKSPSNPINPFEDLVAAPPVGKRPARFDEPAFRSTASERTANTPFKITKKHPSSYDEISTENESTVNEERENEPTVNEERENEPAVNEERGDTWNVVSTSNISSEQLDELENIYSKNPSYKKYSYNYNDLLEHSKNFLRFANTDKIKVTATQETKQEENNTPEIF